MTPAKATVKIEEYLKALAKLKEAIDTEPKTELLRDALIQRFEFCFELSWKAVRHCLEIYGHETASPLQSFKKAYSMRWIDDEHIFTDMMKDRNLTSHTYKEKEAAEIAGKIPGHYETLLTLAKKLESVIQQ